MKIDKLTNILITLGAYKDPQFFKDGFVEGFEYLPNFNKKRFDAYYRLLSTMDYFVKKLLRYELYFSKFYNEESIPNSEALEHHVTAYLQDVESLKNRLISYLGLLKNQSKMIYVNKEDIEKLFKHLSKQVEKSFKKTTVHSTEHRHGNNTKFRFTDSDITDSKIHETILKQKDNLNFSEQGIEIINKKQIESFNKAQERWIKNAKNNESQILGIVEETLKRTEYLLFTVIGVNKLKFNYKDHNEMK